MYQKLYIDSNLKNQHSEKLEKILIKNEIPFEYLEDNNFYKIGYKMELYN